MSEYTKTVLRESLQEMVEEGFDISKLQAHGPVKVVEAMLAPHPDDNELEADIAANRAEAERFVAGLLGMA